MNRKRITYIVSNVDKALAFEWVVEFLDASRFSLSFILLNPGDSALERFCRRMDVPVKRITYRGKRDVPRAFLSIFLYLVFRRPHFVHCHMFEAYVLGVPAAWLAFIRGRVYTRHNATYHREYYPRVVKFDAMANRLSSRVVATSENVARVLRRGEGVPERKVCTIRHGFPLEKFMDVPQSEVDELAARYGTAGRHPVVGVIARYLDLKGIQYVIPAWKRLREEYPDSHLVLANARGPFADEITRLLSHVPESAYTEIPFEDNIYALYNLFDIHVHVPINPEIEAFGQTYVEALASGTPSVFTMSGVAPEFVRHEQNALVVPFEESAPIYEAMKRILTDDQLRRRLIQQGKTDVQQFGVEVMIRKLQELYSE